MIIAYHAIFTTYGTWLPNDPRGSYSENVYNAELAELGAIHYGRQELRPDAIRRAAISGGCDAAAFSGPILSWQ